jgi:ABC-type dipeptide/oligopeptide/nickel transport system permease component
VALGLDQPLWQQFLLWLGKLFTGDLGTSIFTQVPVSELLAQRLEPTLSIAALTMLITLVVSVPLGTLAAYRAGSWVDRLVMLFAVLCVLGAGVPGRLPVDLCLRDPAAVVPGAGLRALCRGAG